MATSARSATRRRVIRRLAIAAIAGAVIAVTIGLGAHNAFWVAFLGAAGIVAGLALAPRPSRLTEMPEWELAGGAPGVRVHVESITRSALNSASVQPTSVTARVTPADDTSYRTTWITSMTKSYTDAVLSSGGGKLLPESVPPRPTGGRRSSTPQFADYPGRWALIYPAVTVGVCAAVLFGVPTDVWRVDAKLPSASTFGGGSHSDDGGGRTTDNAAESLDARLKAMIGKMRAIAPATVATTLSVRLTDSGSDYGSFYDPGTGQEISLYRTSDGDFAEPQRRATTQRDDDAFDLTPFTATKIDSIVAAMKMQLAKAGVSATAGTVEFRRTSTASSVGVLKVSFDTDVGVPSTEMQAHADGTVAEYFNPGDFPTSFRVAREALVSQRVPLNSPVLERFEVRGTAPATPTMYAGSIQSSGGVYIQYRSTASSGSVAVVPGQFPQVQRWSGRSGPPEHGFSFGDLGAPIFESVRTQAMQRGGIKAFDRDAIDIEAVDDTAYDVPPPFIRVSMSKSDAASGRYSMTAKFLLSDYH
ncbi:hypothetical protein HH308_03655 [Gordonia sp. TBRC 11910]|uniref:Uncharacterized protein n=1 Tax=Gordonia asplenii TaxID=2725283 RepID=A0A848KNP5_9ACTN|nr:hypothetical protein [Gordonia asplenii]NMO00306.1 hypothetical protein [Gordonia asplenii]